MCSDSVSITDTNPSPPPIIKDPGNTNDPVIIIDNKGKEWNITHAVKTYEMNPEHFQFGLGPFAIQPILNPKFINPGSPDNRITQITNWLSELS